MYESKWLPLEAAATELGVSVSTLYRLRRDGYLRPAVHWHRATPGRRSPVQFNVSAVRLLLQVACSGT
jgi:hypothetical protein